LKAVLTGSPEALLEVEGDIYHNMCKATSQTRPLSIDRLAALAFRMLPYKIATCSCGKLSAAERSNPINVKVVTGAIQQSLYISRARQSLLIGEWLDRL